MPRTLVEVPYHCSQEEAKDQIEQYLKEKKFMYLTNKKGEEVWQQGKGYASAIKFLKIDYDDPDKIKLYAWIAGLGLGTRSVMEVNLKGFYASRPKHQLKKVMSEIKGMF